MMLMTVDNIRSSWPSEELRSEASHTQLPRAAKKGKLSVNCSGEVKEELCPVLSEVAYLWDYGNGGYLSG